MSEPTPYNVSQGPVTLHGEITHGHVIGVRLQDGDRQIDVVIFGATAQEADIAARRMPGRVMMFGDNRPAILAAESQIGVVDA